MSAPPAARPAASLLAALALYAAWTVATWALEGRMRTLLRPEAAFDRALYAVVANLLIGTVGAAWVVRGMVSAGHADRRDAGFGPPARSALAVAAGLGLGFGLYAAQGAPTLDPVVLANAFAQVLVVSIAEVMVCWAVVGSAVLATLRVRGWRRVHAALATAVAASLLFGLYHYAHSPPFDSHSMVALLAAVSLATGLFFFVSRDVYGTVAFHNWLGVFGVAQAMRASGTLDALSAPRVPLLAMGAASVAILVAADRLWIGGRSATPRRRASQ
jgi:Na+-transporting NADH:ubiquinone oxidoreductase subunit NqrB